MFSSEGFWIFHDFPGSRRGSAINDLHGGRNAGHSAFCQSFATHKNREFMAPRGVAMGPHCLKSRAAILSEIQVVCRKTGKNKQKNKQYQNLFFRFFGIKTTRWFLEKNHLANDFETWRTRGSPQLDCAQLSQIHARFGRCERSLPTSTISRGGRD